MAEFNVIEAFPSFCGWLFIPSDALVALVRTCPAPRATDIATVAITCGFNRVRGHLTTNVLTEVVSNP